MLTVVDHLSVLLVSSAFAVTSARVVIAVVQCMWPSSTADSLRYCYRDVSEREQHLRRERLLQWKERRCPHRPSEHLNLASNAATNISIIRPSGGRKKRRRLAGKPCLFEETPTSVDKPAIAPAAKEISLASPVALTCNNQKLDTLDSFMENLKEDAGEQFVFELHRSSTTGAAVERTPAIGRFYGYDNEDEDEGHSKKPAGPSALELLSEQSKRKMLVGVDHSAIAYAEFRKNFYIESPEVSKLSEAEVAVSRTKMNIRVKGDSCPKPISTWDHAGLSLVAIKKLAMMGFSDPFFIQKQALPAIMMGRDLIGVAKTGSGKTLAFVLPMLRHVRSQPRLTKQESGPIALIMAPARELAVQIYTTAASFCKDEQLRAVCVYGGANIKDQIAALKRGSEVVVGTPGRLVDILCMNSGRIMSLERVTYVVLDEADRMFDMGFEPQISMILKNVRPDRQTVLFSATFPRAVETLAKTVLQNPIEIMLGQRSATSDTIKQIVEVHEPSQRFPRLLQILGTWHSRGNVLIFVDTQKRCDELFHLLGKAGYPALSLHGGKDQIDRDYTIKDFKEKVRTIMVATSVAGRGLDVPDLVLVINFSCPNHMEDYVHRIGRTGRADTQGTAYTFVTPGDEKFAPDIVKAMHKSDIPIPVPLQELVDRFKAKLKRGEVHKSANQYTTVSGFTFDAEEMTEEQRRQKNEQRQFMIDSGMGTEHHLVVKAQSSGTIGRADPTSSKQPEHEQIEKGSVETDHRILKALAVAKSINQEGAKPHTGAKAQFEAKVEINAYPKLVRQFIMHKATIRRIADITDGAAVVARGSHVPEGKRPPPGEEPLHLVVEAPTQQKINACLGEIHRLLEDSTRKISAGGGNTRLTFGEF